MCFTRTYCSPMEVLLGIPEGPILKKIKMDLTIISVFLITAIQISSTSFSSKDNFQGSRWCRVPLFDSANVVDGGASTISHPGQTIKLKCKHKFYEADATSVCLNGRWSYPDPPCEFVQCPDLEAPVHGTYELANDRGVDAKVTFECIEGYWLQGSKTRVCQRNGNWSGVKTSCTEIICPPLVSPNHGSLTSWPPYRYNDEVGLTCKNTEVYDGNIIKCLSNATWSEGGTFGKCIEISKIRCSSPQTDNMLVSPDKETYTYKETIKISCEEGFIYNGSETRKCLMRTWTGKHGTCNRIYCKSPKIKLEKGTITSCKPCPFGTLLNVTCDEGYEFMDKPPVCRRKGQVGIWEYADISCKGVKCSAIPQVQNGYIVGSMSGTFKDKRVVKCNDGFYYHGDGTTQCQYDGKWSYPGSCHKNNLVMIITVVMVLLILAIAIGIFISVYIRWKRGTLSLRLKIWEGGHVVEKKPDRKIDLDTEFMPLEITTYTDKNIPKWADNFTMDKYISHLDRFNLIETDMDGLISNIDDGGLILVYGRAGVGKTTLIQKLTRMWAKKEWAKGYGAVFIYNMRYISPKDNRPMTLAEFLHGYMLHKPKKFHPTISKGISREGKGWIIFMDAIDEFPHLSARLEGHPSNIENNEKERSQAHEWCIAIWKKQVLARAVVILTSRHIKGLHVLEPVRKCEVIGLTPETIKKMVDSKLQDKNKADRLKHILEENAILSSISSISFFCMMLCKSFHDDAEFEDHTKGAETYTRIMAFLIQNYIRRNVDYGDNSEEIPLNETELIRLKPVAKLAYLGMVENKSDTHLAQLIFEEEEIELAGICEADLNFAQQLGLLTCTEFTTSDQKAKKSMITEFMHLSMQEFLAMTHLLNRESAEVVEAFNTMWKTGQFHMAQLYLFGLLFDDGISGSNLFVPVKSSTTMKTLITGMEKALVDNAKMSKNDRHQVLRVIQIVHETRNAKVANKVADTLFKDKKAMKFRDMPLTAVDLLGIIFMLKGYREIRELSFDRVKTDDGTLNILAGYISTDDTIRRLSLNGVPMTKNVFQALLSALLENKTITSLHLDYDHLNDEMMEMMASFLKENVTIQELSLAHNTFMCKGMTDVLEACTKNSTLKELIFEAERINGDEISAIGFNLLKTKTPNIILKGADLEPSVIEYINSHDYMKERVFYEGFDQNNV